jgi:hypothetical protein
MMSDAPPMMNPRPLDRNYETIPTNNNSYLSVSTMNYIKQLQADNAEALDSPWPRHEKGQEGNQVNP